MSVRRDDDVVTRAKAGDPAAWRHLYKAHAARLRVWLELIPTGDAATDANDVAATAWLTASRRIREFNGCSSDFAGWLFTIARNVARTSYARSGRRRTQPVDVHVSDPRMWGTVADADVDIVGANLVYRLIRRLSPREAEVVTCIDVAGFDVSTTARILDLSEVAVRVSHHRGINRLRALLTNPDLAAEVGWTSLAFRPRPTQGLTS